MKKIANTTELQSELHRILAAAQSPQPSRASLAAALKHLSERVAHGSTALERVAAQGEPLLQAKIDWAMELAELMRARFSGAGGWRDHHIKSEIRRGNSGVHLNLESPLGWSCNVGIDAEGDPQINASFSVDSKSPPMGANGLPDLDQIDLSDLLGTIEQVTFPIKDREPMSKPMMALSLWISKQLPRQ